jgi:hypothetical protein
MRRWLRNLFAGDAPIIVAMIALVGTTVSSYVHSANSDKNGNQLLCQAVLASLNDDRPNPLLNPADRRRFVETQLKILDACAN